MAMSAAAVAAAVEVRLGGGIMGRGRLGIVAS